MSSDRSHRRRFFEEVRALRYDDTSYRLDAETAVTQNGRWEATDEFRMGAYFTDSIERITGGFRGSADLTSGWRSHVDLPTFDGSWEAVRVLHELGVALAYALNWTKEPSPAEFVVEPDGWAGNAYLKQLARETANNKNADGTHARSLVEVPPPTDWNFEPEHLYVVTVQSDSLVLESDCTTLSRAHQYLDLFDAVITDLLEILAWKPLPATD